MLTKLFRPKWQHRKMEVRLSALQDLAATDPVLLQVAREDREPVVRQQAVRLIGDPQSLLQLLAGERDETVREVCCKRLKRLLAGQEQSLALEQRLKYLAGCPEEEITAYVLQHAGEAELRRAALATVSRPSLLAEVALNDPSAELRLAAVERIDRHATLERVAREARGKDKRVSRRAKEKLEAERVSEIRPQRQAAICEAIDALVSQGGADLVSFRRQQEEWDTFLPAVEPAIAERYAGACARFTEAHARLQAEAAATARQRELCEGIEQVLGALEQEDADPEATGEAIERLQRDWDALAEVLPELNVGLQERFNDALAQAGRRRTERQRRSEELASLQALLGRLERTLEENGVLSAALLRQIEADWQAAGGGRKLPHTAALCDRFDSLLRQAKKAVAEQGQAAEAMQREYAMLLGQMEAALGEGQVQAATACRDKLADREKKLAALGGSPNRQQQRRSQLANARLRELRDWRRFGTDTAREELLARIQELQATPLDPLKQAEAVKSLRTAWRELDRKDGAAAEPLWQTFEQAAEAAYAPCREYYEEQASQRAQHLQARREFLAALERDYEAIDWEQPDWAALEAYLQQAQKQWPKLGGVDRSGWAELNARFKLGVAAFERHLSARRDSEKHRREALIQSVEALADEPDLEKALAETRAAQDAWRPDVPCAQRVEQALWHRFKAACDKVYERRKAKAEALRRAQREQAARLQQLCEQAEALAGEMQAGAAADSRLTGLQQQWREYTDASTQHHKALQQRFDAALAAVGQAEEAQRRRQASAGRELLLDKASLCVALEQQLLAAAEPAQFENLVTRWQGLQALSDARLEQALASRFERTLRQLRGAADRNGLAGIAQANLAECEDLCLQLEILAGVESPAEHAEARLAMQVQLLAEAMTGQMSEAERQSRMPPLLERYLGIGPLPPQEAAGLNARLGAVVKAAG